MYDFYVLDEYGKFKKAFVWQNWRYTSILKRLKIWWHVKIKERCLYKLM